MRRRSSTTLPRSSTGSASRRAGASADGRREPRRLGRRRQRSALLALAVLAAGCASSGLERQAESLEAELRRLGFDPDKVEKPTAATEEMVAWVREKVPAEGSVAVKAQRLFDALARPHGLDVKYNPGATGTAAQVFATRQANCLGFANLYISLAREIELPAYHLSVETDPRYEKEGDLVLIWEHVTAAVGDGAHQLVLQLDVGPDLDYTKGHRISELTALAMFYSNKGAELLVDNRVEEALGWLEKGVRFAPDWAQGWLNLGVARRRLGELEGAEEAYRRAIAASPGHLQAYQNLRALLRLRGEEAAARELVEILDRADNRDPYIYLSLGDDTLAQGDLETAARFYRRARRLAPDKAEVAAALGELELELRRPDRAARWLARAASLDPDHPRVGRGRRALAAAGDAPPA